MAGVKRRNIVLQERDRRLLSELTTLRVVDREMASTVGPFNSKTRANARLLALTQTGLLRRTFVGAISGGRRAIYARADAPMLRRHRTIPTMALLHQLAVNEVCLAARFPGGDERANVLWQTFDGPIAPSVPLIPDGYLEIQDRDDLEGFFVEVDRATESLRIWRQKAERYLGLATSDDLPSNIRRSRFGVLVVAESERRLSGIRRTVATITDKLFWFTTLETIKREGFWSACWIRPGSDEKLALA